MSEPEEHSSFVKTPQQLLVVVLLGFAVPVIAIVLLVHLVVNRPSADPAAMTDAAIAERIRPVGRLDLSAAPTAVAAAGGAASAPASAAPASAHKPMSGKQVFDTTCMACHATGAAGAPKVGDKAAWAPRIKLGIPALLKVALHGKGAMPPKGGNAALSEAEIRAAIEYMTSRSK